MLQRVSLGHYYLQAEATMSEMTFGFGEENARDYIPIYAGINWHEKYMTTHEKDNWPIYAHINDEFGKLDVQLTQENCAFYLNETDKDFDCVVITDPRDENGDFWYSRYDIGSDLFDEFIDDMGDEVTMIFSKYPGSVVADFVMRQLTKDSVDEFPDDWET